MDGEVAPLGDMRAEETALVFLPRAVNAFGCLVSREILPKTLHPL